MIKHFYSRYFLKTGNEYNLKTIMRRVRTLERIECVKEWVENTGNGKDELDPYILSNNIRYLNLTYTKAWVPNNTE